MKNKEPFRITEAAIYYPDGTVERLYGSWTTKELSLEYPLSASGIDTILCNVPISQLKRTTVVFFDNERRVIPDDPRVLIEDSDLI